MKFLQRLISKGILKSIEKLALRDPEIRANFDKFTKDSDDLAKSIADYKKRRKQSGVFEGK